MQLPAAQQPSTTTGPPPFLLLKCYLDEAGDRADASTVVAGFVSTVALWEQFEVDWRLMLASYKVPYFHMKEFSQSTGPFKKWRGSTSVRNRFSADATDIIRHRSQGGVFFYVHHATFGRINNLYKLQETLSSPYAIAGRACVAKVGILQSDAECIFEDGGPDKNGLLSALNVPYQLPVPMFKPSRDITDKRGVVRRGLVQLQAADFLAYELRKHRNEFAARSGRPVRQSFYELLKVQLWAYGTLLENNVMDLCQLKNPLAKRAVR
jgi:hypothetical protein